MSATTEAPQFASNMEDAAKHFGVTKEEFVELKESEGFPPRTSEGWDITAITEWLDTTPPEPPQEPPTEEPSQVPNVEFITIRVPVCDPDPETYIAKQRGHVDARLRGDDLEQFRRIHAGLRAINATFPNGKPVESAGDVVKYMMSGRPEESGASED